ncbi:MAG: uracil-DNA glycosylase [Lewinellaceae bacterium]|nr:uracil-DNA glycosylase [Lewinellaceae bacterium]
MNPDKVEIHPRWKDALHEEFSKPYFDSLVSTLKAAISNGKIIYPPGKFIFHAFNELPPEEVKVVILGQDPYHNPHEAMGLSFSVPKGIKVPPSLANVYKELHRDIGFKIPVHGDLSAWSRQGVLLLNAILTVESKNPGSHRNIGWQTFTDMVIHYLSEHYENIVFMLWGNFAKSKRNLIDVNKHLVLEAAHPSPLAGNAFQGCSHFSKANDYFKMHNKQPIDWTIV